MNQSIPLDVVRSYTSTETTQGRGSVVHREHNGVNFSFRTGRIRRLAQEGASCVCCGKHANDARIVPSSGGLTIDVGHLDDVGNFTRLTIDHLLLDCLGGRYDDNNIQIMCVDCNTKKGDVMSLEEIELVRRNPTKYASDWVNHDYLMYLLDMQEYMLRLITDKAEPKVINQFRVKLASARKKMNATTSKHLVVPHNIYADILRPPVVNMNAFAVWWKSMPSIREAITNWMLSHNIIFC